MRRAILALIPVLSLLSVACTPNEDDFMEEFVEALCEKAEECDIEDWDDYYDDADECIDEMEEEYDDDYFDDCDYDEDEAKDCLDAIRDADCDDDGEEFWDAIEDDCDEVWDCDNNNYDTYEWDENLASPDSSEMEPAPLEYTDLRVAVSWGLDELRLEVTGASGPFWFGIAETLPGSSEAWTGEDCLEGTETQRYCHPVPANSLTLRYGSASARVIEGETTAFSSSEHASTTTFSLWDTSGQRCLGAWGADPTHYEGVCEFWF